MAKHNKTRLHTFMENRIYFISSHGDHVEDRELSLILISQGGYA